MFTPQHLIDCPAVFEGMPPSDLSVCNSFNRAVRELTRNGQALTPIVLQDALQITFDRFHGQYDRQQCMGALVRGGFEAPRGYLPPEFAWAGYGPNEVLSRVSGSFGAALRGIGDIIRDGFEPQPGMASAFATCRPGG